MEAPRGRCVGILTPKDVLLRVVARGRSAAATSVEDVMTPAPDVLPGTATVLQALHQMQAPARFHPSHRVGHFSGPKWEPGHTEAQCQP